MFKVIGTGFNTFCNDMRHFKSIAFGRKMFQIDQSLKPRPQNG